MTSATSDERERGLAARLYEDHPRALVAVAVVLLLAMASVFLYADFRFEPSRAEAWFAGLGVVVAGFALIAALLAAWLALPGYVEWEREQRRHPDVRIHVEVGPAQKEDLEE